MTALAVLIAAGLGLAAGFGYGRLGRAEDHQDANAAVAKAEQLDGVARRTLRRLARAKDVELWLHQAAGGRYVARPPGPARRLDAAFRAMREAALRGTQS